MLKTNIAIIGGGITGLSVAASIKERFPSLDVIVFERSAIPYGASTRNAGFACFGSLTEVMADLKTMSKQEVASLIRKRWEGLHITRKRLGDEYIGFKAEGGFELVGQEILVSSADLREFNELAREFLPNYFTIVEPKNAPAQLKVGEKMQLISMRDEAQLDAGLLMRSLLIHAQRIGVSLMSGVNVNKLEDRSLQIQDPIRGLLDFNFDQVVVCNNAFAKELIPDIELEPGRGQVFVTKPIEGLKFKGNVHLDQGYYYLRNVENRILFGGGRNLDFENETTTSFEINPSIQSELERRLPEIIDLNSFEIDMRWAGIMAFGTDKLPIVNRLNENIIIAVKMGGMGVAIAGAIGEDVIGLI